MFSSPFSRRPQTAPPMFMFSSCSVHTSAPKRFFSYPEGQRTNVLFIRKFDTRYSHMHPASISLARAPQLSIPLHLSLARTQLHPIRLRTHADRFRQVLYQGRCTRSPPLLNCTYPSLTRVFSTPTLTCTHPQRTKPNTGTPSGDEKISGNRADHPHILE